MKLAALALALYVGCLTLVVRVAEDDPSAPHRTSQASQIAPSRPSVVWFASRIAAIGPVIRVVAFSSLIETRPRPLSPRAGELQ